MILNSHCNIIKLELLCLDLFGCSMEKVSSEVSESQRYHAVWQYVHCLLGISYEDYKNSQLDLILSTDLRSYIKLVTFCPERLSEERFHRVTKSVSDCDKVSIKPSIQLKYMHSSDFHFIILHTNNSNRLSQNTGKGIPVSITY